ncbi:MAG: hypothetical protein V3W14_04330 [Candidatus Neomarinimicrobiota bacterium]
MKHITLRLPSNGPIDLALCNQPATELESDRAASRDGAIYRAGRIAGVPVLLRARSIKEDEIEVRVSPADEIPLPDEHIIATALRRKFSLDLDLPAFYDFLKAHPKLQSLPVRQRGLRPILKDSLLEALWLAVMDQQVNVAFAGRLKRRFLEAYGRCYDLDGLELWLLPTIEEVAGLDLHALCPLQFTRNRSSFIIRLARRFLAEPQWETLQGTDEEVVRQLCQLNGVGPWTAEYAAMVGLGLVDTFPAADIGLLDAAQQLFELPERPTADQVRKLGQDWSPWRGLVTFYIWHQYEMET